MRTEHFINWQNLITGWQAQPLLPESLLWLGAILASFLLGFCLFRYRFSMLLRSLWLFGLVILLTNPHHAVSRHEPGTSEVLLMIDQSPSMQRGLRPEYLSDIKAAFTEIFAAQMGDQGRSGVHLTTYRLTEADNQTNLITATQEALAQIPPTQRGGVIWLTDGQIHDADQILPEITGPRYAVVVESQPDDYDRVLYVEAGLPSAVKERDWPLSFQVVDYYSASFVPAPRDNSAKVTIRQEEDILYQEEIEVGQPIQVNLQLENIGQNFLDITVAPLDTEMDLTNNHDRISVQVIPDRMRVLLVSGRPSLSTRMWRSLLHSDPQIDLVHFTILRPPSAIDAAPLHDLSLISFPVDQLFLETLPNFDLVIFDLYENFGTIRPHHLSQLVDFVQEGGGLLVTIGAGISQPNSLFYPPLGDILPARENQPPSVFQSDFIPSLSSLGQRHPITRVLAPSQAQWGSWQGAVAIDARPHAHILLEGAGAYPAVLISEENHGRVAIINGSGWWQWLRGIEGGGPALTLLRNLISWLLHYPEFEAENLQLSLEEGQITVTRQSLQSGEVPVQMTRPDGTQETLIVSVQDTGRGLVTLPAEQTGIYEFTSADLSASLYNPLSLESRDWIARFDLMTNFASEGIISYPANPLPEIGIRAFSTRTDHDNHSYFDRNFQQMWWFPTAEGGSLIAQYQRIFSPWFLILWALGGLVIIWLVERKEG